MVIETNSGFFFRDTDYKGPGGRLLGAGNILNTGTEGGSKNCSRLRMICALYSMDAILQLYIFKTLIQQLIDHLLTGESRWSRDSQGKKTEILQADNPRCVTWANH